MPIIQDKYQRYYAKLRGVNLYTSRLKLLVSCPSQRLVLTFVHTATKEYIMDTRIQFRVDEETKRLAQQMAESQGRTLSDACRELTEQLAEQQRKTLSHDAWLTEQVNLAFEKFDWRICFR